MSLKLMYITNNPEIALIAEKAGVDRIWIDLETIGKEERQHNMDTVKSKHSIQDVKRVAPLLSNAKLLVRINPWGEYSPREIEEVIKAGADIIMLPMWKSVEDVENFLMMINGRCKTILLLETKEAVSCIENVLHLKNIDEIHIGLNDLSLSYGFHFMFEPLSNGLIDQLCYKIKQRGIPYGFGGISKIGDGILPAERILIEHYRLGSSAVILSRSFCNTELISDLREIRELFEKNIDILRKYEQKVMCLSKEKMRENQNEIKLIVNNILEMKRRDSLCILK